MGILVAILIIAVIAALAFAFMQRRRATGAAGPGLPRSSRAGRSRPVGARRDPMRDAVLEHANATEPHDAVIAEQRLQAQAGQIAAGMQARAQHSEHQHAADQVGASDGAYAADPRADGYAESAPMNGYDPAVGYSGTPSGYSTAPPTSDLHLDDTIDPQTGQRTDGYGDPNQDPRLNDRRYEGRIARDYDPNTENPEFR
ncbi:MAG: hypothetical protein QOE31_3543 [Solirubrobacteraceae bacterium]|nr:hypothetical protein [Solirubrobacteraceae bacterium]